MGDGWLKILQWRCTDPRTVHGRSCLIHSRSIKIETGDGYDKLKPTICIHFLNFKLFDTPGHAAWCFEFLDRRVPSVRIAPELQLHVVELPKAEKLVSMPAAFKAWITYLKHGTKESIMQTVDYPPVQEAMEKLRALSSDKETRRLAELRERSWRNEESYIRQAEARGEARGEAKGAMNGWKAATETFIKKLMADGKTEAEAMAMLGL